MFLRSEISFYYIILQLMLYDQLMVVSGSSISTVAGILHEIRFIFEMTVLLIFFKVGRVSGGQP